VRFCAPFFPFFVEPGSGVPPMDVWYSFTFNAAVSLDEMLAASQCDWD
jgi:hypothetical protein